MSHARSYHEPSPFHELSYATWWIHKGHDRIPSWQARAPRHQSTFAASFCPPRQTVLEVSAAEHKREESIYITLPTILSTLSSAPLFAHVGTFGVDGRRSFRTKRRAADPD